jgi:ABC-2 type transport system ATP-binding protein
MMHTTTALELDGVSRSFVRGSPVLSDVSFSLEREEVVALLGRNGSGKTTLMQIVMGMLYPHAGSVRVFGMSPTDEPVAVKRRIGYVAEDQIFPSGATIPDLMAFHRRIFPTWDVSLEKSLLSRFELDGRGSSLGELSKGQARQVALVCAISHRPELLILDEPAGGLDPAARREFLETSIQLLNREGTAILFSSHHMSDVERLGGRVVLLDDGKVLVDEELDALRESYCVAAIPRYAAANLQAIERLPSCMKVHEMRSDWHAVFRGSPERVQSLLRDEFGLVNIQCIAVPLEELFIELVGGERNAGGLS